jgi:hypothetical protein
MSLERARKIADAVLYEGYLLYPYRASARKNQLRFQFGVLVPRAWSEAGGSEDWWMNTDCIVEAAENPKVAGTIRFLQIQDRIVEAPSSAEDQRSDRFHRVDSIEIDGRLLTSFEEGIEREVAFEIALNDLGTEERIIHFTFEPENSAKLLEDSEKRLAARIVRHTNAIDGVVRISAARIHGSLTRVSSRIENVTLYNDTKAPRDEAIRASFVGTHTILSISDGRFVSLIDPPEWARAAAIGCANVRTWPVLIGDNGERDVILSSPIILQDYPEIAPESAGDLFDSSEIDEILTLRTMTLPTMRSARRGRLIRARARSSIESAMPPEMLDRLHGAMRYLREATNEPFAIANEARWWDPGADASVSPETDSVEVDGVAIAKGGRVRLLPGARRADAQDMFLEGRIAQVQGVFIDVENRRYLAVTLEDDPAAEFHQWHGRYFYFSPDEVEPLEASN